MISSLIVYLVMVVYFFGYNVGSFKDDGSTSIFELIFLCFIASLLWPLTIIMNFKYLMKILKGKSCYVKKI